MAALPTQAIAGAQEVETLRKITNDLLDKYELYYVAEGDSLVREGDILIEDSGSYYSVTLPHLKHKYEGGLTDIGMIAVNAVPEKDDTWKITLAMPTPIVSFDANGKQVASIAIGAQNFTGVWDEKINYFTVLKAAYRDLDITLTKADSPESVNIKIPESAVHFAMKEGEPDRWSGPMDMTLKGVTATGTGIGTLNIDEIIMKSTMKDYSFEAARDHLDNLLAMEENFTGEEAMSPAQIMGFYNMFTDYMALSMDAFDTDFHVNGVTYNKAGNVSGEPTASLASSYIGFGMGGFHSGSVYLNYKMGYKDVTCDCGDTATGMKETLPHYLDLDMRINNIPFEKLVELGKNSLKSSVDNPDVAKVVGIQALMTAPKILTEAETNLTIDVGNLGNDLYDLDATGKVIADMAAQMGAVGDAKVKFQGLDKLITKLNDMAKSEEIGEAGRQKIQNLLGGLAILQMAGQVETGKDGAEIRVYNFEVTQDGKMLLNGADMSVFMGQPQ